MARKVTKAQLLKKAARLKIKGRSTMSKAELEKAVSPSSRRQTPGSNKKARGGTNISLDRQRRARKPGKRIPRGGGAPYYERRANRSDRGQMLDNYSGFENAAAFWFAITMSNDETLYKFFKRLIEQGRIVKGKDLEEIWRDIIGEERSEIEDNLIDFHYARSKTPFISDMAEMFLNQVTPYGWEQILDDFTME